MKEIKRRSIDWEKTGKRLQYLRDHNTSLRRYACSVVHKEEFGCGIDCEECKEFDMDNKIAQDELAKVFNVSANTIANWESGRTIPDMEDLILYSDICEMDLFDILAFNEE